MRLRMVPVETVSAGFRSQAVDWAESLNPQEVPSSVQVVPHILIYEREWITDCLNHIQGMRQSSTRCTIVLDSRFTAGPRDVLVAVIFGSIELDCKFALAIHRHPVSRRNAIF